MRDNTPFQILRTALLVTTMAAGFVVPAAAQQAPPAEEETSAWEISGGYAFVRDAGIEENLKGWVASVARNISSTLGIVGEVEGVYERSGTFHPSVHSFVAGPRLSMRGQPAVTPYVQLLVGMTRYSELDVADDETVTSSGFSVQPGGGVDVRLRPNVGLRVGADYRRTTAFDGINMFRFHVGVVVSGGAP